MTILVTGATGNVGRNVVELLLEAGSAVRATSRNPASARFPAGVEVRALDLTAPDTFAEALAGVQKVFLFPEGGEVKAFVSAAESAGVRHAVLLSSLASGYDDPNPIGDRHLVLEKALTDSTLTWTFLRPGAFATNTLAWAGQVKSGVLRLVHPAANVAPIHERDIAAAAVAALLDDAHAGAIYPLTGAESITQQHQAELIAAATGLDLKVEELTEDEAVAGMLRRPGVTEQMARSLVALLADATTHPAEIHDNIPAITGNPARTFASWATDHKADFQP